MNIKAFLRSIALSKGLSEEQLDKLARSARQKTYHAGQMIISEKDKTRTFFVLVHGKVKMFKSSIEGKEQTLSLLRQGGMFGMCAAFSDSIFPANAMALEETEVLLIPSQMIDTLAQDDPRILFNIIFDLSCMLKDSMALVESLSLKDIPQRLATFLLISTPRSDADGTSTLHLPVSQRELAKMLGTSPETLSRVLKKMSVQGIIEVKGRNIKTLDREALEDLAQG